ncbi:MULTISPECIES: type II toxin-antitoxin system HicA family toxin [Bacillales]|uniref:Type II toxin-antitoxin system HicA family toxin n=1 Tax=Paenibacillus residui TaxID=629724 RepID=A0ABW3DDY2_9BACL|nr:MULTISPECIES: type II toxin-antitoxin system HicA family toxin [Paenibacillaceae]MBS5910666.1 type II toxin-antitoxin system HicA family toxin [Paenibacillus macerans]MDU5141266.1 type II toxin-antitoxin system HicA family toxin [Paenibacillus dendritiformis]MDU7472250.1 type II toxin-antitoxin system HicA family toxin [Paenibacillus macerans]RNB57588.1 type II toxin-antitoxin system HicA family toxin [Brevibacillus borstelensis]
MDKYNSICYRGFFSGSHHQFKHPTQKGRTTVKHPDKDIPVPTLKSIERRSGLKFE